MRLGEEECTFQALSIPCMMATSELCPPIHEHDRVNALLAFTEHFRKFVQALFGRLKQPANKLSSC